MPKEPKVNIKYGKRPKVHYTDIIDPEHFREVTMPALFRFLNEEPRDSNKREERM